MALADEIKADIYSDDLTEDLFETVVWGTTSIKAMVNVTGVQESYDDPGGTQLSAEREFKFRREEVTGISADLSLFGTTITYNGRKYDITEVDERPDWPLIVNTATLRR